MAWMWPPQRVKRCVTPWRASALETSRPPWTCIGALYHARPRVRAPARPGLLVCCARIGKEAPVRLSTLVAVTFLGSAPLALGCHHDAPRSPVEAVGLLGSPDWKE